MGAGHDKAPTRLHSSAFWLLGRAARQAEHAVQCRAEQAGIRRYFYGVLATLDEFGPAAQAQIGRRITVDPSDMVAVLNELTDLGYVRRDRDPDDRRRNRIDLTEAGRRALDRFDGALADADADALGALTDAEGRQLVALLRKIVLPPA